MEEQGGGEIKRGKGEQEEFFSGMAEAKQKRQKEVFGLTWEKACRKHGG